MLDLTWKTLVKIKTKSEIDSLTTYEFYNFEFFIIMVIRYRLLYAINTMSEFLPVEMITLSTSKKHLLILSKIIQILGL